MRSRYAIAGTLLLVVVISGVYLAMSRGWVFAQTSQGQVCSNATLQGAYAVVLTELFVGNSPTPNTPGFVNGFATLDFNGAGAVTVSVTQRLWTSATSATLTVPGTISTGSGTQPGSYAVNQDCTFLVIVTGDMGGPIHGQTTQNGKILLLDATTRNTSSIWAQGVGVKE